MLTSRGAYSTFWFSAAVWAATCFTVAAHGVFGLLTNKAQLAAYHADPHCGTALVAIDTGIPEQRCTVDTATIFDRWWVNPARGRARRYLVLVASSGATDSVLLERDERCCAWQYANPGRTAYVERFASALGKPARITAVRTARDVQHALERTERNPEVAAANDESEIVRFGVILPLLGLFICYRIRKRQRIDTLASEDRARAWASVQSIRRFTP